MMLIAASSIFDLMAETQQIVREDLDGSLSIADLATRVQVINGRLHTVFSLQAAGESELDIHSEMKDIKSSVDKIIEEIKNYKDVFALNDSNAPLDELIRYLIDYRVALDWVDSMLEVDFSSAVTFIAPFNDIFQIVNVKLNEIVNTTVSNAKERSENASNEAKSAIILFALTTIFISVGASAFSWFFGKYQQKVHDTTFLLEEKVQKRTVALESTTEELNEKNRKLEAVSNKLSKYLSPQVYNSIFTGVNDVRLNSKRKKLTVFFSDIVGFTKTTDTLEAEELTQFFNSYLTEMSRIALDNGATIDKYIGDAIMIFFGDPESKGPKQDAIACVRMALQMQEHLIDLRKKWEKKGFENPFRARMGIATGYCTVGNFGSESRMDYTIIGGVVNLASRLESLATPDNILISFETYALVHDEVYCLERKRQQIKGIAYPIRTFEVINTFEKMKSDENIINMRSRGLEVHLNLNEMDQDRDLAVNNLRKLIDRIQDL